jgi:hypothetical protein
MNAKKRAAFFKRMLASPSLARRLERLTPEQVMWLCEAVWNVTKGRVPLSTREYKKVKSQRDKLKRIAKCRTVREGRGRLVQYGGALLPILIPAIISALVALSK